MLCIDSFLRLIVPSPFFNRSSEITSKARKSLFHAISSFSSIVGSKHVSNIRGCCMEAKPFACPQGLPF